MVSVQTDTWYRVLERLRKRIGSQRFELWFKHTELVSIDHEVIEVGAPNHFVAEWLQTHFAPTVAEILKEESGDVVRVRFKVSPHLYQQASQEHLSDLAGIVSEASEFISESTQRRLDELIGSLTHLSDQLQGQLAPLTPAQVDQAEPNQVLPNITTAVMRLDQALKNVNIIIGDRENQQNIKQGLAGFSVLIGEMRQGVKHLQDFSDQAAKLTEKTSKTIENIDGLTGQTQSFLTQITPKMQNVTDELVRVLDHFDDLLRQMSSGQGTAGRILSDPKLYEELTDTTVNLNNAIGELRTLMAHWKEHGILYKEK